MSQVSEHLAQHQLYKVSQISEHLAQHQLCKVSQVSEYLAQHQLCEVSQVSEHLAQHQLCKVSQVSEHLAQHQNDKVSKQVLVIATYIAHYDGVCCLIAVTTRPSSPRLRRGICSTRQSTHDRWGRGRPTHTTYNTQPAAPTQG